jgi:hypothetical protein
VAGVIETVRGTDEQLLGRGDVVRTADDPSLLAEVVHRNGALTRLDRVSEITVDREDTDGRARIVVTLGPGRTWHHTGPLGDPTLYEVRCPNAVLTARFAAFSLLSRPDGSTEVTAVEGNVVVRGTVGGSVALGDGQRADVAPDGVVTRTLDVPDCAGDPWVSMNRTLDEQGGLPETPVETPAGVPVEPMPVLEVDDVELDTSPLPRWLGRSVGFGALAVFLAVLVVAFITAEHGDREATKVEQASKPSTTPARSVNTAPPVAALPAGAAAMIRAAQDRTVAPDETTTTTAAPPAPAAPVVVPPPAELPRANATGTSCRRSGRSIVYSGTLTNVSSVASSFTVDTVFVTASGVTFTAATVTVAEVAPHRSAPWEVRVSLPSTVSTSGASCDVSSVRAV